MSDDHETRITHICHHFDRRRRSSHREIARLGEKLRTALLRLFKFFNFSRRDELDDGVNRRKVEE